MSEQPNETLFVSNLDTKINKHELRRNLYYLFTPYGPILSLIVLRNSQMRGQAHIVFPDLTSSTAALRALSGRLFLGRPLRIAYARSKSWKTIEREEGKDRVMAIRLGKIQPREGRKGKVTVSSAQNENAERRKERERQERGQNGDADGEEDMENDSDEAMEEDSDDEAPGPTAPPTAATSTPAHNVLALSGLPSEVTNDMLEVLFAQYPGFVSARTLPRGAGVVQYDTVQQAGVARGALDGFLLSQDAAMAVAFAPRG